VRALQEAFQAPQRFGAAYPFTMQDIAAIRLLLAACLAVFGVAGLGYSLNANFLYQHD
jgi:hypothetical protein